MIFNFSPISIPLPEVYLTVDETDILLQCKEKGELDATLCKPKLLCTVSTTNQPLYATNGKFATIPTSVAATANFSK